MPLGSVIGHPCLKNGLISKWENPGANKWGRSISRVTGVADEANPPARTVTEYGLGLTRCAGWTPLKAIRALSGRRFDFRYHVNSTAASDSAKEQSTKRGRHVEIREALGDVRRRRARRRRSVLGTGRPRAFALAIVLTFVLMPPVDWLYRANIRAKIAGVRLAGWGSAVEKLQERLEGRPAWKHRRHRQEPCCDPSCGSSGASGREVRRGDGWHYRGATSAVGQWTS